MLELYRFPLSANVERVALALGHKGLEVRSRIINPGNRESVRAVSGQDLVPVLVDDGQVVVDSTAILRHLETRFPQPPLFFADPARGAELDLFLDWFNRTWKRLPNSLYQETGRDDPDPARVQRLGSALAGYLDLFDRMLDGREYLMGAFSAADCAAWPFLRYALELPADDPYRFHEILHRHQPLQASHARLRAWIQRVAAHPMA